MNLITSGAATIVDVNCVDSNVTYNSQVGVLGSTSLTNLEDASKIFYDNTISGLTAENVKDAIDEIASSNDSPLLFGAGSISATPTTRYLFPGYDDGLAQTIVIQIDAPYAGTLRDFYVRHNTPGVSAVVVTYTVRVNGVATAISASLAASASSATDLVNTVTIVAGDLIDVEITKAGNIGGGLTDVTATLNLKVF